MVVPQSTATFWQRLQASKVWQVPPARPSVLALAALAWILALVAVSNCTFVVRTLDTGESVSLGLFSQAVYDADNSSILGCVQYQTNSDFGSPFTAGRAFGVLTAISTSAALLAVAAALLCYGKAHDLWTTSRVLFILSTLFQLFTFLALGGCDDDCRLSGAGAAAVLNVFCLTGLSILAIQTPAPQYPWWTWAQDKSVSCSDRFAMAKMEDESHVASDKEPACSSVFDHCFANGDFLEMEVDDEDDDPLRERPTPSVISVGASSNHTELTVTESLILAAGVQRLKRFRLCFFALVIFAWILSIVGVQRCTFLLVGPTEGDRSSYSGLGLYTRASYSDNEIIGCLAYPENIRSNFESSFSAARVFGAITGFLTTSVLLLVAFQLFGTLAREEIWMVIRCLLPSSTVAQLLTFVAYNNELCTSDSLECVPGGTGIMVIINILLLVALSILTIRICPPGGAVFERFVPPPEDPAANRLSRHDSKGISRKSSSRHSSGQENAQRTGDEATESDSEDEHEREPRRVRIAPVRYESSSSSEQLEMITIRVEFTPTEKKTIKEIVHPDGSKTFTTTIEELMDDVDIDDDGTEEEEQEEPNAVIDETDNDSHHSSHIEPPSIASADLYN